MVRCLQWLAGRPVTFPVPPDFPTADKTSIRPEIVCRTLKTEAKTGIMY